MVTPNQASLYPVRQTTRRAPHGLWARELPPAPSPGPRTYGDTPSESSAPMPSPAAPTGTAGAVPRSLLGIPTLPGQHVGMAPIARNDRNSRGRDGLDARNNIAAGQIVAAKQLENPLFGRVIPNGGVPAPMPQSPAMHAGGMQHQMGPLSGGPRTRRTVAPQAAPIELPWRQNAPVAPGERIAHSWDEAPTGQRKRRRPAMQAVQVPDSRGNLIPQFPGFA